MKPDSALIVRSPADLVDAVPYVIGFHPADSLVVLGLAGDRLAFGARFDLPPPTGGEDIAHLAAIIAAQRVGTVALIAYGPPAAVDPVVNRAIVTLDAFGIRVNEAIRVHESRWRSYLCDRPMCCPPEGNPCSSGDSVIAAEATYRGHVVLPNREALVARVAPVGGAARKAMTAATARARERLQGLLLENPRRGRAVRRAGRLAIREAEKRYRSGKTLTDDEVAWLGVLLIDAEVNDYALERAGAGQEWLFCLWSDVVRRVDPGYATAPACVLSFAAWQAGQGALARVAVDRALQAEPLHRLAGLLDDVLGLGVAPHAMTTLDSLDRGGVVRLVAAGGSPDVPSGAGRSPVEGGVDGRTRDRPPHGGRPGSVPKPRPPKGGDPLQGRRSRRLRRRSE